MLKATLLATAVLALASPALAFGPSNFGLDTSDLRDTDAVAVQCYPSIDYRRDRDPVTHTDIVVRFQPGSDWLIQSFVVNHHLMSGRVIDRDRQYAGTTSKKPGHFEWYWEGRQYQNPRIIMLATLVRTQHGERRYQETVYRDGRLDHAISSMHCERADGEVPLSTDDTRPRDSTGKPLTPKYGEAPTSLDEFKGSDAPTMRDAPSWLTKKSRSQ